MKKFILLAAAVLMSTAAFADSYTIVFNDNVEETDGTAVIKPDVTADSIAAEGAEFIASVAIGPNASTSRAYFGRTGYGLKFGNSSNPGNLVVHLSAKGQVNATSIVVKAAPWWNAETGNIDTPHATINGFAYEIDATETALKDYEIVFDEPQFIDTLYFHGTEKGRSFVKSVTINYEAASFDASVAHAPHYAEGKAFEVVLGPDLVQGGFPKTAEDGTVSEKNGISEKYDWVEYINPTSTLDNGKAEVQTSNRWTNYDPNYEDWNYGEGANWIQVKGENGSVNSPVLSAAWGKYMNFVVKETSKMIFLGVGSAGGSAEDGNCLRAVALSEDGDVIEANSTPGGIYGKGTASDTLVLNLDPEKVYQVTLKGDETAKKDIMLGGFQIFGVSEAPGIAPKAPEVPNYAYWETVKGPDMLTTKPKTADDGTVSDKPAIALDWIEYVNPTSTLDDGTTEVQVANRTTDLNPETGERGEAFQVTGADGSVNSPVISAKWGKYLKFFVKDTKKFTVYATGSASGTAEEGNYILVTAKPFTSHNDIVVQTEPGTIWGKGAASDCATVELDPTQKYEIWVQGAPEVNRDIQITGVTLQDEVTADAQEAGKGTLNIAIEKAVEVAETGVYTVDLEEGQTYTLAGEAPLGLKAVVIFGNNATVVTDETGQITVQTGLTVTNLNFDCAASTVAPIAMSEEPDESLYTYSEETTVGEDGTETVVGTYKYEGASQKVYEGGAINIIQSNFANLPGSLIDGGTKPWALHTLYIDEAIVQNNNAEGKAIIRWDGGANSIQAIKIDNSTFYNTNETTSYYFLRFSNASNARPSKVWGSDPELAVCSWNMKNNTFVNSPSNQNFANNYVNDKTVTAEWTENIFVNTWRLQKAIGGSCNYVTDSTNCIWGGVNAVDNTDATKFAVLDSMDIQTAELPALDLTNPLALKEYFAPFESSYAAKVQAGDPRWAVEYVEPVPPVAIEKVENEAISNAPAYNISGQRIEKAQGLIIRNGKVEYIK
ncbi:MAG: DUF4957 domain-containing protein [Bacteroidales bacterium]|nr:DUF4957 domain-containing protein [Bacteroidales bacterium]